MLDEGNLLKRLLEEFPEAAEEVARRSGNPSVMTPTWDDLELDTELGMFLVLAFNAPVVEPRLEAPVVDPTALRACFDFIEELVTSSSAHIQRNTVTWVVDALCKKMLYVERALVWAGPVTRHELVLIVRHYSVPVDPALLEPPA
ncbi:hypothetical protein ABZ721_31320 [Streptomyces sp. NPDC006733]|uniref:hypothetical protein n=1 Tax=Streptomyces sp. NPDC006733 TaxID=3155460 RepID=UPI0034071F48